MKYRLVAPVVWLFCFVMVRLEALVKARAAYRSHVEAERISLFFTRYVLEKHRP